MNYLFHLFRADHHAVELAPASLRDEGFVHLSTADQVLGTAERWFTGETEVKMAVLDRGDVGSELRWEDLYGHGEPFPHLYGPIPAEAVRAVVTLERDAAGRYRWPAVLAGLLSPLLEPLSDEVAVIEPGARFATPSLPRRCLLCFFQEVLEGLPALPECEVFTGLGSEVGAHTVYTLGSGRERVAVCHPGVGGSLAAATVEELIALGCDTFLLCGGAGSLVPEQTMGHLVVVDRAWRDEGTSHHYLPPAPFVEVEGSLVARVAAGLERRGVTYTQGATWTTDALYRETPSRVARRREAGCLTVEMELASLLAVTRYRACKLGAVVYCGDDVGAEQWDFRDWTSAHSVRQKLFRLGLEVLGEL